MPDYPKEIIQEKNTEDNGKTKLPKLFIILRIIATILIVVGIVLLVLGITKSSPSMGSSGWFDAESSKYGLIFGGGACLIIGGVLLFFGFVTSLFKVGVKAQRHLLNETQVDLAGLASSTIKLEKKIIEENKDDLKNMSDMGADISKDAIRTTAGAVREGLFGGQTPTSSEAVSRYAKSSSSHAKYCKHCGSAIEPGAKFCGQCGNKL